MTDAIEQADYDVISAFLKERDEAIGSIDASDDERWDSAHELCARLSRVNRRPTPTPGGVDKPVGAVALLHAEGYGWEADVLDGVLSTFSPGGVTRENLIQDMEAYLSADRGTDSVGRTYAWVRSASIWRAADAILTRLQSARSSDEARLRGPLLEMIAYAKEAAQAAGCPLAGFEAACERAYAALCAPADSSKDGEAG